MGIVSGLTAESRSLTAISEHWLVRTQFHGIVTDNDKFCQLIGYDREEIPKLEVTDFELIKTADDIRNYVDKIIVQRNDIFGFLKDMKVLFFYLKKELVMAGDYFGLGRTSYV